MKLIVETNNLVKFNALRIFLRSNGYKIEIDENTALSADDWIMPGRPATDKEHEALAHEMELDSSETDAKEFFNELKKDLT